MVSRLLSALKARLRGWGRGNETSVAERYGLGEHQVYPTGNVLAARMFVVRGLRPGFTISSGTRIASIGSCFAREIKQEILRRGYTYVQTEENAWSRHSSCGWERVYTTACAAQIVEYSVSGVVDRSRLLAVDHRCRDLWRHHVWYGSVGEAERDLESHVKASRSALGKAQVLVFTVGQNEGWYAEKEATASVHGFLSPSHARGSEFIVCVACSTPRPHAGAPLG